MSKKIFNQLEIFWKSKQNIFIYFQCFLRYLWNHKKYPMWNIDGTVVWLVCNTLFNLKNFILRSYNYFITVLHNILKLFFSPEPDRHNLLQLQWTWDDKWMESCLLLVYEVPTRMLYPLLLSMSCCILQMIIWILMIIIMDKLIICFWRLCFGRNVT